MRKLIASPAGVIIESLFARESAVAREPPPDKSDTSDRDVILQNLRARCCPINLAFRRIHAFRLAPEPRDGDRQSAANPIADRIAARFGLKRDRPGLFYLPMLD